MKNKLIFFILVVILLLMTFLSARYGAVSLTTDDIASSFKKLFNPDRALTLNENIFLNIRLPRVFLSIFAGAALSVGGILLQSLFANPIIEPGLIGVSGGAALGAAFSFVFSGILPFHFGAWNVVVFAFIGSLCSTGILFILSYHLYSSHVIYLLLIGIAVNAMCLSGVGFLSYIAKDPQARTITFWTLGTLSGANWLQVIITGIVTLIGIGFSLVFSKQLNALMLGSSEAGMLGVNIYRLKYLILIINILMISTITSFVGIVGFVGLIVPSVLRLINGSDNFFLIWSSALLGAILLVGSDFLCRMVVQPAELPIGIITSLVGAPLFIVLLRKKFSIG